MIESLYVLLGTGRCTAHTFSSSMCIFYAAARLCFFSESGRPFCCYHHNAIYTKNQVSVHYFCTLRQFCAGLAANRREKEKSPGNQRKTLTAGRFWLGRPDLNRRMEESKSSALPLGDGPIKEKTAQHITVRSLVGCLERFELSASRATIWRANQLRHRHHRMRPKGLEPLAHCLEGSCSIHLSYGRAWVSSCCWEHAARIIIAQGAHCVNSLF